MLYQSEMIFAGGTMKISKKGIQNKITLFLCCNTLIIVLFIWLNEIVDMPHVIFGAVSTPVNWVEALMESLVIIVSNVMVWFLAARFIKAVNHLAGFYRICSACRSVEVKGNWIPLEELLRDESSVDLTHTLCNDCARKLYNHK